MSRQRLSPDERRAQLVAAAVGELAAKGFRATTADGIAKRAAVSKGLLWHYFDDLDDLLQQTAQRTVMTVAAAVGGQIDLEAAAPDVIRSAIHAAAQLLRTHADERRAINEIVFNLRSADGTQRLTMDDYAELHTAQAQLFRRGQEAGDFRSDLDPHVLAVTYQGAVDAMLGYLEVHPEIDPDTYADALAEILLNGVRRGDGLTPARSRSAKVDGVSDVDHAT